MDDIANYLKNKIYPKEIRNCEWKKRNFRRDCAHFLVDKGVLYKKEKRRKKRVLNEEELQKVLQDTHTAPHGGHLGVNKTYVKIHERYFCKRLFERVRNYIEECDGCQRKGSLQKEKQPLHSIPVSDVAFSKIGMDLIGPLPETKDGKKYILVFTEYLTKWVDAEAVPDKKAETILNPFIKFVCTHGMPETLITDQGKEFCNELNDKFCQRMGIKHNVSSPYHPQTGGHTERLNRTLSNMLVSYVNTHCNDWDSKLPFVLFAYRTAQHSTTQHDPFFLVYGRKARLPIELELPMACDDERVNAFVKLEEHRKDAAQNIKKGQSKQKKHYDSKLKKCSMFNVDDEVLLHNTRKLTRKGGKLNPVWSGPHTISEVLGNGCYKLDGNKVAVNGSRLKAYSKHDTNKDSKQDSSNAPGNDTNDDQLSTKDETESTNTTVSSKDKQDDAKETTCLSYPSKSEDDSFKQDSKQDSSNAPGNDTKDDQLSTKDETESTNTTVSSKDKQDDAKETTYLSYPNKSEDDSFLPPKKRRRYKVDGSEHESNDVIIFKFETDDNILFDPAEQTWQNDKSKGFGLQVKNYHKPVRSRPVSRNARPVDIARMRGDGNCLFRTFSYLIFGVQTYYAQIRRRVIDFMIRHSAWFEGYVDKTLTSYLNATDMWDDGQWGTDVEIRALATLLKTNVFVYCISDTDTSHKWIKYTPIDSSSDSSVYMWHRNGDHYEPVLDVEEQTFSKTPYMPIGKYVPKVYWKHVPLETLEGALVDNYADESKLQNMCTRIKRIYVRSYTDKHYQIPGTEALVHEMDSNIFNILCDQESFAEKLSTNC